MSTMDFAIELAQQYDFFVFVTVVYLCGIVTGICLRRCYNLCARHNLRKLRFDAEGFPSNCPLPLETLQGTTTDTEAEFEVDEADAGIDTIYWCFDRQMYHCRTECPVLIAVGRGRTLRTQQGCQVCMAQPSPTITVTSGGSKFHSRDCRAVCRSKTLELTQCPICFEKPVAKID